MKIWGIILGLIGLFPSLSHAQLFATGPTGGVRTYDESTGAVLNPSLAATGQPLALAVSGSSLYVTTLGGPVAEYNAVTGATINASLVSGLSDPRDLVISGSNLYVTDHTAGTVGEYNATSGAAINTALISGLGGANGIAISGANLYVANATGSVIGEYNATTGAVINASLVTSVGTPRGLAVAGGNLYIANFSGNSIAKCNATTGAIISASFITGLNQPEYIAIAGTHLYVANQGSGTIGEYDLTTGAAINASLVSGLVNPSAVAVIPPVTDVGSINVQKTIIYDQNGFTAPALDPQNSYQFEVTINPGSTGALLPYSTLTPPSGSTGSVLFQAGSNGLDYRADFGSQAQLDAGFADGIYNTTIQTTTPNTYSFPLVLAGDNYPAVPQLTSVTNATWVNGHLQVTDPSQPTVFNWTSFSSAAGNINFQVNNSSAGESVPALATNINYTIPGGTLTNNTAYEGSLNFSNSASSSNPFNVGEGIQYQTQVNFDIWTGTPAAQPATINLIEKDHVVIQTSNSTPVNGSGDNDDYDPAPYFLQVEGAVAGTATGPAGSLPVTFKADNDTGTAYSFSSGAVADQGTLDSFYGDGTYTLTDGNTVVLTGDVYPNTPQVLQVNGTTPIWNAQGQLVLNPAVSNTITWTPFSVSAGTFAAKGHEQVQFHSDTGDSINIKQLAGISESSTTLFNSLTVPANAMTANHTYVGKLQYFLGSTVNSPSLNIFDAAGYQTKTFFTAIAAAASASPQTINFPALGSQQVIGTNVTLVATSTSGLPVAFTVVSGPASLSSNVLTFTGTGTVTIQANQAGNSIYGAAPPVSQTFTVTTTASGGIAQTINFPQIASPQNSAVPVTLAATSSSGLPITYSVTTGSATITGNVVSFFAGGTVTINANQPGNGIYAAATTASQSFGVNTPTDLGFYQIQKSVNYNQFSPAAPILQSEGPYQFSSNVDPGSSGLILSSTTLTPPVGSTGTVAFQAAVSNLNFDQSFVTKSAMDTAFAAGNYQLTVQTSAPETYSGTLTVGADNYPPLVPQITALSNATWASDGSIAVTNIALPVGITFTAFNSALGNIYFEIDNTSISLNFPANGSTTVATIPANTFTTANTLYHAAIGFQNTTTSTAIGGISGAISYSNRLQINIKVGTPPVPDTNLFYALKSHVLVQSSAGAPVNGSGDKGGYDAAPYSFESEASTPGSFTSPAGTTPLVFDTFGNDLSTGNYRYFSGAVASQTALDATYPDGTYTLADGNTASITGDTYPNTPQISTVNGAPPIWNSAGQLVLDPTISNTLTWTSFSIAAGTFASNGHETAEIFSNSDNSVNIQQKAGVTESSSVTFNTATIPAGTFTTNCTYVGDVQYLLASSVNSPGGNNVDFGGYQTETFFTILAQPLPTALSPTFNSATDVAVTGPSYIATGINFTPVLNFTPSAATTLTVINNTGSGPITGTFNNVAEGGTINATFGGTTYTFTATYKGGDGNDMTLTYTLPLPPSSLTILHSFGDGTVTNDAGQIEGPLTQSPDGNFYGTSIAGGVGNFGVVYKITPQGQVTILHSFGSATNGGNPTGLSLSKDGNFYGLTELGGADNAGTIFKITPQGQFTLLHTFGDGSVSNDGAGPEDVLFQASDGNFYSTTNSGGSAGQGTVFKVTPQGQVTILHSFGDGSVTNDGLNPACYLFQASDGNFYGTTNAGGSAGEGTVFKITPQGQVTILHSFQDGSVPNDGADPFEGLVQASDGNFYSVTLQGGNAPGPNGNGTVFKVTPQGQLTILHRFNDGSIPGDGQFPIGRLLMGRDGNFYGGTRNGGNTQILISGQDFPGAGVLFKITPQGVVTILHTFEDGTVLNDGGLFSTSLNQASDGTFYGATLQGGSTGGGAFFKLTPGLPVISSPPTANGTISLPFTYQTTAANTPTNYAATNLPAGLSINPATGLISGTPTAVVTSATVLTLSNARGPASSPLTITISALPPPIVTSILSAYATVGHSFAYQIVATNNPTSYSASGLPNGVTINTSTGLISGTPSDTTKTYTVTLTASNASGPGASSALAINLFASPPTPAQEYNILHRFDGSSNDAAAPSVIFQGFDGSFYGISAGGGDGLSGALFNITNQGVSSVFHSFITGNTSDGLLPQGLLQAADGSFYGTSQSGGLVNKGIIFKIAPDGTETILHSFGDGSVINDGATPTSAGVTQGADGNFYGTTQSGGAAGLGTVYRITPLGAVTILHSFGDSSVLNDGASPEANLLQGADGNFYGTTLTGGAHSTGTIFKITPTGTLTILHSFQDGNVPNDGASPLAPLIQSAAGIFYGTTTAGGLHGTGTVFQMSSDNTVTLLHNFGDGTVSNDGADPRSPLVQGFDGNFYGMTREGGLYSRGAVFEMNPAGTVILIHQFGDPSVTNDGSFPVGPLYQDASGNFYGTTQGGGTGSGTVFSFVTAQPTTHVPIYTGASSLSAPAQTPFSFTPKAFFGVSTDTPDGAVQSAVLSQVIHKFSSLATNWTLTGTLPQFLTFDSSSGTISGMAIQPGTYTFTLTPNNAAGTGTPQIVTLYIDVAPTISSPATASSAVSASFTYSIVGTATPTSFGATGLPGWLSVNTRTGVISGTPPGTGAYNFSPTASNIFGTGTEQVTLNVIGGASTAPLLTSATTASVTVGNSFTYQITGSHTPTSFGALTLPAGLLFDPTTGIISGTPTTTGIFSLPISATNTAGTASGVLLLTVNPAVSPTITSCSSFTCSPSTPISYQITGTNSPTSFAALGLPTGLSLDPATGIITGTPASTGNTMIALSATNSIGTGTATLALIVQTSVATPALTSPSTATATASLPFSYQVVATNNPTSYAATGLPDGVTINPNTGLINGTPTTSGTYDVTIYVTGSTLGTGASSLTLTFNKPSFNQWATLYPSASLPAATPYNDGVPNLLKYLYDINPTHAMTASDQAALPALGVMTYQGAEYLTLTYRQYSLATGVSPQLQSSSDMQNWSPIDPSNLYQQTVTDPVTKDMTVQVGVKAAGTRQFIRLNVSSQ